MKPVGHSVIIAIALSMRKSTPGRHSLLQTAKHRGAYWILTGQELPNAARHGRKQPPGFGAWIIAGSNSSCGEYGRDSLDWRTLYERIV